VWRFSFEAVLPAYGTALWNVSGFFPGKIRYRGELRRCLGCVVEQRGELNSIVNDGLHGGDGRRSEEGVAARPCAHEGQDRENEEASHDPDCEKPGELDESRYSQGTAW
jgi:hypothetical protein